MSARRRARVMRAPKFIVTASGGVPRSLAIGPVLEVWAADDLLDLLDAARGARPVKAVVSASNRFLTARAAWIHETGISSGHGRMLVAGGAAYPALAALHRLRAVSCTLDDLADLRAEACALLSLGEDIDLTEVETRA